MYMFVANWENPIQKSSRRDEVFGSIFSTFGRSFRISSASYSFQSSNSHSGGNSISNQYFSIYRTIDGISILIWARCNSRAIFEAYWFFSNEIFNARECVPVLCYGSQAKSTLGKIFRSVCSSLHKSSHVTRQSYRRTFAVTNYFHFWITLIKSVKFSFMFCKELLADIAEASTEAVWWNFGESDFSYQTRLIEATDFVRFAFFESIW